jgi:hypothetical protein
MQVNARATYSLSFGGACPDLFLLEGKGASTSVMYLSGDKISKTSYPILSINFDIYNSSKIIIKLLLFYLIKLLIIIIIILNFWFFFLIIILTLVMCQNLTR